MGIVKTLATGRLDKFNEDYALQQLEPAHLDVVVGLQETVLTDLHDDNAHFLVPKSRAQFWHYLHGHGAMVLGITINGQHAAQIIVRSQFDKYEAIRHNAAIHDLHDYALIQGALTHPAFRGRNLLGVMLGYVTHTLPAATLMARVVPDNVASWYAFMKAGYYIAAVDTDPDDERRVFYMVHDTAPVTGTTTRLVERHEFDMQRQLCAEDWRGVSYDKNSGMIEFLR